MGTNLKWVGVKDINQIPRYLFEQVKPMEYDVDRLYEWAPVLLKNPMNIIGGFLDKSGTIKGVMWVSFNPITNKIQVHIVSIDKSYFGKGIMKEVNGLLNKFKKKLGADKIVGITSRPRAIQKLMGFQRSDVIVVER